jgi:hypothetical protein
MKTFLVFCTVVLLALTPARGQQPSAVGDPKATVTERGPHHAVWAWTTDVTGPEGETRSEQHSIVELATGLNHVNGQGQWTPSSEEIEIFADGAVARQGQHSVIWSPNFNTEGVIDLSMPDGSRMRSHVIGLAFTDAVSGKSSLIAEPKDSIGEVVGNQVIYKDAMNGPFRCDVRYTYTKAGFSQDILLLESPPSPAEYGYPPATTRLEIWTEVLTAPVAAIKTQILRQEADPVVRQAMVMPDFLDQTVDFPSMQIGSGRAFSLDVAGDVTVPVAKTWVRSDNGRQFLVEAVEYAELQPLLQRLQQAAAPARPQNGKLPKLHAKNRQEMARVIPRLPKPTAKAKTTMRMASAGLSGPMVVLDYTTYSTSQTNLTFAADVCYYISAAVNLYGSSNKLEGGTVIKFAKGAGATLVIKGTLTGETNNLYRPAVLTASDDGTVGEVVTANTLSGVYASTALDFDYVTSGTLASLQNIRILYALNGVHFNGGIGHQIYHLQLVNCGNGVKSDNAKYAIRNVLGWNLTNALAGSSSTSVWEHATFDGVTNLVSSVIGLFTNCLLTAVVSTTGLSGPNIVLPSAGGVYKVVGGGNHYLTNGSAYRDSGTTNINPTLANELKLRTTYPPLVLGDISADMTLSPQAGRDTSSPDIGWHYSPLDYWVSGVNVASNVTVYATNGVALGLDLATNSWALILKNARFVSSGDALNLNYAVRAHTVQEKSGGNSGTRALFYDGSSSSGSRECELRLRFTETDQLVNDGYMLYIGTKYGALEWTHSRVYNPSVVIDTSGNGTLICGMTNTLWVRGSVMVGAGTTTGTNVVAHLRNNLARNLSSWHFFSGSNSWTVRDNLFDTVGIVTNNGSVVQNCTNAYYNTAYGLTSGVGNIALGSLAYDIGPLGNYYQPTSSTLVNAGSRTADLAGLYQFTTATNSVKETNSVVDIGIHYVAVNAGGQPIDTDGDGVPDYLENWTGNGLVNSWETSWTNATDLGFKVLITRPRNSSNLP